MAQLSLKARLDNAKQVEAGLSRIAKQAGEVTRATQGQASAVKRGGAASAGAAAQQKGLTTTNQRLTAALRSSRSAMARLSQTNAASQKSIAALRAQVKQLTSDMARLRGSANRAGRSVGNMQTRLQGFTNTANFARTGIIALGAALGARELIGAIQIFQNMENRLRLVTDSSEELAVAQQSIIDVARRTRQSLSGTATFYTRLALSSRELGLSQGELARITETVNQAIAISGATAQEARGGLIQLAQGIASNRLGGEELRSVLENIPAVADAISQGLGVTRGELRELSKQGLLTGAAVTGALQKSADDVAASFEKTTPTISQAWEVMATNMAELVGRDSTLGKAISAMLVDLAEAVKYINDLTDAGASQSGQIFRGLTSLDPTERLTAAEARETGLLKELEDIEAANARIIARGGLLGSKETEKLENVQRELANVRTLLASLRADDEESRRESEEEEYVNAQRKLDASRMVLRGRLDLYRAQTAALSGSLDSQLELARQKNAKELADNIASTKQSEEYKSLTREQQEKIISEITAAGEERLQARLAQIRKKYNDAELREEEQKAREKARIAARILREQIQVNRGVFDGSFATPDDIASGGSPTVDAFVAARQNTRDRLLGSFSSPENQARLTRDRDTAAVNEAGESGILSEDEVTAALEIIEARYNETIERMTGRTSDLQKALADVFPNAGKKELADLERGFDALTGSLQSNYETALKSGQGLKGLGRAVIQTVQQTLQSALTEFAAIQTVALIASAFGANPGLLINAYYARNGGSAGSFLGSLFGGGSAGPQSITSGDGVGPARFHDGGVVGRGGLRGDEVPAILQTGEVVLSRRDVAAIGRGGGRPTVILNITQAERTDESQADAEVVAERFQEETATLALELVIRNAAGNGDLGRIIDNRARGVGRRPLA